MWALVVQVVPALWRVHLGQVVGLFGALGSAGVLAVVLWSCVPSFYPLCCCALVGSLANMALFRVFKAF